MREEKKTKKRKNTVSPLRGVYRARTSTRAAWRDVSGWVRSSSLGADPLRWSRATRARTYSAWRLVLKSSRVFVEAIWRFYFFGGGAVALKNVCVPVCLQKRLVARKSAARGIGIAIGRAGRAEHAGKKDWRGDHLSQHSQQTTTPYKYVSGADCSDRI